MTGILMQPVVKVLMLSGLRLFFHLIEYWNWFNNAFAVNNPPKSINHWCLCWQEHQMLALRREGSGVVLDSELPYLLCIDDDILSTGMKLYHLKVMDNSHVEKKQCFLSRKLAYWLPWTVSLWSSPLLMLRVIVTCNYQFCM